MKLLTGLFLNILLPIISTLTVVLCTLRTFKGHCHLFQTSTLLAQTAFPITYILKKCATSLAGALSALYNVYLYLSSGIYPSQWLLCLTYSISGDRCNLAFSLLSVRFLSWFHENSALLIILDYICRTSKSLSSDSFNLLVCSWLEYACVVWSVGHLAMVSMSFC